MKRDLQNKIEHSIDVIRKAAHLAERATGMPLWLAFSGGKDSQALYHVAKMAGVPFEAHMNFTSVDSAEVIRFVRRQYPDVITHAPKMSIYNMALKKKTLPTRIARWCCAEFKETAGAGRVTLLGVRKAESVNRSKRQVFERVHKNPNKRRQWDFDQFSEHEETMVQCMGNGKEKIVVSPILDWSDENVWEFLNEVVRVPHCELYDRGHKRIGCILCPMASYKQKISDANEFPHVKNKWLEVIRQLKFTHHTELTPEQRFDWWLSGISINEWIAKNILQLKIDFGQDAECNDPQQ